MKRTEAVDGSNESLCHANERMQPFLRNISPPQNIFDNSDVECILGGIFRPYERILEKKMN